MTYKQYYQISFVFSHFEEIFFSYLAKTLNPNICIRPEIWTQILIIFIIGQKSEPEYYSYSAKNLNPNIIHIRIRPEIWTQKPESEYYSYL